MEVEIKDRKDEIEFLRMALAMVEVSVTYEHADLINEVINKVRKKKGKFSTADAVHIFCKWKEKWSKYHEDRKLKNTKSNEV